ncbi:MAG: penicillin acylase family protein [Candidatus Marinimicrobia bacterium]|nr:penicillin acylase family protein [Candidatus Neomarinimicrobiota bacterium]
MKKNIEIWRDENGTPHVSAQSLEDMYWGQGYVHGRDRGMQILLMRILGQGRGSELLDASDDMLAIDTFFRRMNWRDKTAPELEKLSAKNAQYLNAYCDGINAALAEKTAWEYKLLGYKPEQWVPGDSIMLSRMVGYLTLSQSQGEVERLFVEMVQAGVSLEKLEALFPGILGGLDIELIKQVKIHERIVNPETLWNLAVPRAMASNNWVISGDKTHSGKPILANDPHLEVNRLPNIWSEIVLGCDGRTMMGGSMPGMPGILVGRGPELAWGATYSFVDAVDSWIEKIKDGKYYREEDDQWHQFEIRTELIKRRKKESVRVKFYENIHGSLDGPPQDDGYYLATRWAAADSGSAAVNAIIDIWSATSVEDGMNTLGPMETSWDFVFADAQGNIGFQMTGSAPIRRKGISGFVPLPGWKTENDWQGYHSHLDMPRIINPEQGFFSTANHDLNHLGKTNSINMPMGSYRTNRIDALLKAGSSFGVEDIFKMHGDLYSLQAKAFMNHLKPLLPDTQLGHILKEWDLCYDAQSQGAYLFEQFYKELYREVFGKGGLSETVTDYLSSETGTFIDFYSNFDAILLAGSSPWFSGRSREQIYKSALEQISQVEIKSWGAVQQFKMKHILFDGKMPGFLGFDKGPITGVGGRATIHQGQIYRSAGRVTTFMPSFRMTMDMASSEMHSNLAGGPTDRRFSKWYTSGLQGWLDGSYKLTKPDEDQPKLEF